MDDSNNDRIKNKIERKIDFEDIREKYRSGMGIDKIAMSLRLTQEEIDWLEKNVITKADGKVRERNRSKFASLNFQVGTPDHSDRKRSTRKNKSIDEEERE